MQKQIGLIVVMLIPAVWQAWGEESSSNVPLPEVALSDCASAPLIDGKLDDACWNREPDIKEFHLFQKGAEMGRQDVWMTCDARWLYVAVRIKHPNPKQIKPVNITHDSSVTQDDSIEVFLDPGTEGALYYHFKLNAANARAESRVGKTEGVNYRWDIGWRSGARITETGWEAEMAIPMFLLTDYGDLAKVRVNVCLNVVEPIIDPYGIRIGEQRQLMSWSPVQAGFHEPNHFGLLKGLAGHRVESVFLPRFQNTRVGGYDLKTGEYNYGVKLEVRNESVVTGMVRLVVLDEPAEGEPKEAVQEVALGNRDQKEVEIKVSVKTLTDRKILVSMKDAMSGEEWQVERIAGTESLRLLRVYADRNYYTSEDNVRIFCRLGLPEADLKGMKLEIKGAGVVLGGAGEVTRDSVVALPLAKLALGSNCLAVALARKEGGSAICRESINVFRREPRPGVEWKIDQDSRKILKNNKPFFPFGVIFSSTNEAVYKEISEAGFNSIVHWSWRADPTNAQDIMTMAAKYNLDVVMPLETFSTANLTGIKVHLIQGQNIDHYHIKPFFTNAPGDTRTKISELTKQEKSAIFAAAYEQNVERMLLAARNLMNCPNLIAYDTFDEPFGPQYFDQWVQGLDLYRRVNAIDGYHPWFVIAGPPEFDFCEVIGGDPYWIPAATGAGNSPVHVVGYMNHFTDRAEAGRKAIWEVPLAEYWSGTHKRPILPQEQYCQTYLLLIHEACSLFYFVYPFIHEDTFTALAGLAKQMQVLGPAAAGPRVRQAVRYEPGEMDVPNRKYPDVHAKMFHHPDGGYVLLAANGKNYPVEVSFAIDGLEGASGMMKLFSRKLVTGLFSGQAYSVKDNSFSETLEGYGVRAYWLKPKESLPEPVGVSVKMKGHPEVEKAEVAIPRSGREGKKNLVPNPSLEEASLPGWPDYFRPYYMYPPRIGQPDAKIGLDTDKPFHGKVSMRLVNKGFFACYLAPNLEKPAPFVFSVYLRSGNDGTKFQFMGKGFGQKTFNLTREWQRYSETAVLDPKTGRLDDYNLMGIRMVRGSNDTNDVPVWVDAIQVEKGEKETTFEP